MNLRAHRRPAITLAVLLVSAALACGRNEKPGPFEKAGRAADEAVGKATETAKDAAEKARKKGEELKDTAERAAAEVGKGAEKAGDVMKETAGNVKKEIQKGERPRPTPVYTPGRVPRM